MPNVILAHFPASAHQPQVEACKEVNMHRRPHLSTWLAALLVCAWLVMPGQQRTI